MIRRSLGVGRRRSRVGDKGKYWNRVWTTGNDSDGVGLDCLWETAQNLAYGFLYNDGTKRRGKILEIKVLRPYSTMVTLHGHQRSEWYSLKETGMKDGEGQNLREVLLAIIEKSPSYDMDTEGGCQAAANTMAKQLSTVIATGA
ncbi:hypothetical protein BYT27DRAFT_7216489 [Phlegmacium glaucopus]|nr:hypothetical protein BYT27DRAFT_7216489 [Phlegmacium glaucopus]